MFSSHRSVSCGSVGQAKKKMNMQTACQWPQAAIRWREKVVPKSYSPKGQPRSTRNEFPIRADFGNSRKHPIWRLKRGGKLTAKGAVLSPEKRDFTVLLMKFAFIVTFEEFLVLYSEQSFYKCLISLSCPAGRHYRRK